MDTLSTVVAFPSRQTEDLSVNAVCKRIRQALHRRSGVRWSVTHGTGTAHGWISIDAPRSHQIAYQVERVEPGPDYAHGGGHDDLYIERPAEAGESGHIGPYGRWKLGQLLGLDRAVHFQGESIPASHDYYREFIARAEGQEPQEFGRPYWD